MIVQGVGPSLFGRNWLEHFHLDWQEIHCFCPGSLESMLEGHQVVFQDGLGTLLGHSAKIVIDPKASPQFCKARPIPYAMRSKVEAGLDHLMAEGTLEPVQFSEWAAPIVVVLKMTKPVCGSAEISNRPLIQSPNWISIQFPK